jgi:hypothetical protein
MTRVTLALLCLVAAIPLAHAQSGQPPSENTGGMSYPAPVPGSGRNRPAVAIPEPGGMRELGPVPGTGAVRPGRTGRDTGSMQYPDSK